MQSFPTQPFRFVNAAGASMPVRWSMVTAEPFEPEAPDQATAQDKNSSSMP